MEMKLQVLQEELAKALLFSIRFVNPRAQLPILANVLLAAKGNKLSVLATNLEVSLALSIGAKIEKEGKITVPAKTTADLISNLPPDSIRLLAEKEQLKVASRGFSGFISGTNASDFPSIPQTLGKKSFQLPKDEFTKALNQVIFAASIEETRPVLTGVLFLFDKKNLVLVASDGFRLSQKKISFKQTLKPQKMILPRGALSELAKILATSEDSLFLQVRETDNQAMFGIGSVVLTARMLEGEFPSFEKIIPKSSKVKIRVDKEDLTRAIRTASVFARESANIVNFDIKKGQLLVSAESSKSGSQKTKIEAKVEGERLKIAYNFRFVEDFLSTVESDEVQVEFTDTRSPGVFKDPKDPDFLHLIMPVRVQG